MRGGRRAGLGRGDSAHPAVRPNCISARERPTSWRLPTTYHLVPYRPIAFLLHVLPASLPDSLIHSVSLTHSHTHSIAMTHSHALTYSCTHTQSHAHSMLSPTHPRELASHMPTQCTTTYSTPLPPADIPRTLHESSLPRIGTMYRVHMYIKCVSSMQCISISPHRLHLGY